MHIEIQRVTEFSSGCEHPPGQDNPSETQTEGSEKRGRRPKILIVDDSLAAWLRFAREILTEGGFRVHACDAPEALELFKESYHEIDLVITDLQMPGLDGIELAAELLKINPALPVVLTSAAQFEMSSEKLQSLGIRDFLPKPWERERLFSVLQQALSSTRSEEPR